MTEHKINLIKTSLVYLIKEKGSTTTLDIKNRLRNTVPHERWYQDDISDVVEELEKNGDIKGLGFTDNGTFRNYSITSIIDNNEKTISRTDLISLILEEFYNGTDYVHIIVKKDKVERDKYYTSRNDHTDVLGYIDVYNSLGEPRKLDPRKVVGATIGSISYRVK